MLEDVIRGKIEFCRPDVLRLNRSFSVFDDFRESKRWGGFLGDSSAEPPVAGEIPLLRPSVSS